jgi:hypothetical protein
MPSPAVAWVTTPAEATLAARAVRAWMMNMGCLLVGHMRRAFAPVAPSIGGCGPHLELMRRKNTRTGVIQLSHR